MIKSFKSKSLRALYEDDDPSKLPPELVPRVRMILTVLDAAGDISDLDQPTLRLHALKGRLKGYSAVTVRANWRIIFKFRAGDAHDVDFIDYH